MSENNGAENHEQSLDDIKLVRPVDWNNVTDEKDKMVWDRLTGNFWLPEKIDLVPDLDSWDTLNDDEKWSTTQVFAGLTLLDTVQGTVGAVSLIPDAITEHEKAVYNNIGFMEAFDGDTELLTPDGWKKIKDIRKTDEVAQFDPENNNAITFVKPRVVPSHYAEQVFEVSDGNGGMVQVVSNGHRVYTEHMSNTEDETWEPSVYEAHELFPVAVGRARGYETSTQNTRFRGLLSDTVNVGEDADNKFCFETGWNMVVKAVDPREVYCVQVPSTYLVTRYGNSNPVISGNCVHAKSYSSIFSTLLSSREIEDAFRFAEENEFLKRKQAIVLKYYYASDPEKRKILSTLLESFLFYSGFFMPFWWASKGKLPGAADIIRLIVRDESVHGYYIGYKFQKAFDKASPERQQELLDFTKNVFEELFENEMLYTAMIYDPLGLTEHVKTFLKYNANKAFSNLGMEPPFSRSETKILPEIESALNPSGDENFDFFSGNGANYVMGSSRSESLSDDEWDDFFDDDDL